MQMKVQNTNNNFVSAGCPAGPATKITKKDKKNTNNHFVSAGCPARPLTDCKSPAGGERFSEHNLQREHHLIFLS